MAKHARLEEKRKIKEEKELAKQNILEKKRKFKKEKKEARLKKKESKKTKKKKEVVPDTKLENNQTIFSDRLHSYLNHRYLLLNSKLVILSNL